MTLRIIFMADLAALSYGTSSSLDALPAIHMVMTTILTALTIIYLTIRVGMLMGRAVKWMRNRKARRN